MHSELKLLCCIFLFISFGSVASTVTVSIIQDSVKDRENIYFIEQGFEELYPEIDLRVMTASAAQYKKKVPQWLKSKKTPDIFYWYGGVKLLEFAKKGLISPIDGIWQKNQLESKFNPAVLSAVSFRDHIYGVPANSYGWGMYYNKEVFNEFGLAPPTNWSEFLTVCQTLKVNGIAPIAMGSVEPWVVAAWFDYLNIRENGIDYHLALLRGEQSFISENVKNVLERWKTLLDKGNFIADHHKLKWTRAMPFLYRGKAAMTLMGSFVNNQIPAAAKDKIGFFRFPTINPNFALHELAPTDVYMVSSKAKNTDAVEKFLSYITDIKTRQSLDNPGGGLPVLVNAKMSDSLLSHQGHKTLTAATKIMQFFDRDAPPEFANKAMDYFAEFMQQPDSRKLQQQLEALRLDFYSKGN